MDSIVCPGVWPNPFEICFSAQEYDIFVDTFSPSIHLMLLQEITQQHILQAIERYDRGDQPKDRSSDLYDLFFHGKLYPPKVILSFSHEAAFDRTLLPADFQSSTSSRRLLMDRGFPILLKRNSAIEDMFTQEDLYFFSVIKNYAYDRDDPIASNIAKYLRKYIWSRSEHWTNLIAKENHLIVSGRMNWNTRKGKRQGFKKYSWYKLHPEDSFHTQVFFTVGADAHEQALILKLDCLREGDRKLSPVLQQWFDGMLRQHGIQWMMLGSDEMKLLDWDQLLIRSSAYIHQTLPVYYQAVDYISNLNPRKCARICWNTNGWSSPSGPRGKSVTSAGSQGFIHERDHGFAPEEWLFDLDKTIDGYHYSRIEPVHTRSEKHVDQIYDILFYAFNSENSTWYWIAEIDQVEVISSDTSIHITQRYDEHNWRAEQLQQLVALKLLDSLSEKLNLESFQNWAPGDLFNVRFKPEQVRIYPEPVPFSPEDAIPSNHYNLPELGKTPDFKEPEEKGGLDFGDREGGEDTNGQPNIIIKNVSGGMRELTDVHSALQKSFKSYLKERYPDQLVGKECVRKGYRTKIDLVRRDKERDIFYEIKTYPNVLISIRVAIGQLLEYSFYPNQHLASEMVIVTHLNADAEVYAYLEHLNLATGLRIGLVCFDHFQKKVLSSNVVW